MKIDRAKLLSLHEASVKAYGRTFWFEAGTKKQAQAFKSYQNHEARFEAALKAVFDAKEPPHA